MGSLYNQQNMKTYELMTIGKASLGEDGAKTLSATVNSLIVTLKGKLVDENTMGKRKFAYEINHDKEGFYNLMHFEMDPTVLEKFKEKLNREVGLVRYLITAL